MSVKLAGAIALALCSSSLAAAEVSVLSGDIIVKIICRDAKGGGSGTGTRVGPNLVLTAAHVSNGRTCTINGEPVEQVEASPALDFALLRTLPVARWKPISCRPMAFGHPYTAWGFAMGGPLHRQQVFGTIVHPLSTEVHPGFGKTGIFVGFERFIPGMSGGPILNSQDQIVGIVIGFHPVVPASYGRMLADTHLCGGSIA